MPSRFDAPSLGAEIGGLAVEGLVKGSLFVGEGLVSLFAPSPKAADENAVVSFQSKRMNVITDQPYYDPIFTNLRASKVARSLASEDDFSDARIDWSRVTGNPDAMFVGGKDGVVIETVFLTPFDIRTLQERPINTCKSMQDPGDYWRIRYVTRPDAAGTVSFELWFNNFRMQYTVVAGTPDLEEILGDVPDALAGLPSSVEDFTLRFYGGGTSPGAVLYYYNVTTPDEKIYENPQITEYDAEVIGAAPVWLQTSSYPWVFWTMLFTVRAGVAPGTTTVIRGTIRDVVNSKTVPVTINVEVTESSHWGPP